MFCDTVKTCYEAINGEWSFELALKVHFSTTLCWLWEKSPDLRQKVSVVKRQVSSRVSVSPAKKLHRRAVGQEKELLSKQSYAR